MPDYLHPHSKWGRLLLGLLIANLVLITFVAFRSSVAPSPNLMTWATLEKGTSAPDFALPTFDGSTFSLSSFRGQPVILNVWANWCPPCLSEMPEFMAVYEAYPKQGLVVIAVNATFQDSREDAEAFVQELGTPFPIVPDKIGDVTSKAYQVRGLPITIFIDSDAIARHIQIGVVNQAIINQHLPEILQ